jgi:WD40 repeat protein
MTKKFLLAILVQGSLSAGIPGIPWFKRLPKNGQQVEALQCIHENKSLLVSYDNGRTAEWDYANSKLKRDIPGLVKSISHNRKNAVFIEADKAVIRALPTLEVKWTIPGANFSEVLFSPQDQFLVLQQLGLLTIWFAEKQKVFAEMKPTGQSPASFDFSSNEQFFAVSQYEKYAISLIDLKNQKHLESLNAIMDTNMPKPLLAPKVAFHGSRPILAFSDTFNAYVTNIFKPQIVCRLSAHTNFITHLEFFPKSDSLITSGGRLDPRIIIWNFEDCNAANIFDLHQDAVAAINFVGEAGVISGDESGKLYAWHRTNPAKVFELTGSEVSVRDLAICADQKIVASSDYEGNVYLWQLPASFGQ